MSSRSLFFIVSFSAFVLSSCGGSDDVFISDTGSPSPGVTIANVFFYNQLTNVGLSPAGSVTVSVTSQGLATNIQNQAYSTDADAGLTPITLSRSSTDVTFMANRSSDTTLLATGTETLRSDKDYTLVAMGDIATTTTTINAYEQGNANTAINEIRLRFIHTLSRLNPGPLDVFIADVPVAVDLDYTEASDYVTLPALSGTLIVTLRQEDFPLALVRCLVVPGRTYDAIIAYSSFDDDSGLSLFCHEVQ